MAENPLNNQPGKPRRGAGRRFAAGQSGNPAGKPAGTRHAALVALDAIGEENAAAVLRAVVEAAQTGDVRAAEIILKRCWPERRGRPVPLHLPTIATPADIAGALGAVTGAVAAGEMSPEEGASVASILELQRRAVETVDLERRLAAVEARGGR